MMNKKVLIASLGNRDIQFKDAQHLEDKGIKVGKNSINQDYKILNTRSFVEECKKVNKSFDDLKKDIELPILHPVLNLRKYDKIILIATNQEGASRENKAKDTYVEAEIVKKLLKLKYGYKEEQIQKCIIKEDVYKSIEIVIKNLISLIYKEEGDIYLELSGGIPAMRIAFTLSLSWFDKIKEFYFVEMGGTVNIKESILENQELLKFGDTIKLLAKKYEYPSIQEIIDNRKIEEKITWFVKFGKLKEDFDTKSISAKINEAKKNHGNLKVDEITHIVPVYKNKEKSTDELLKEYSGKILELLDYVEIEMERKNWTSFVSKVYRLSDALGLYCFSKYLIDKNIERGVIKKLLNEEKMQGEIKYNEQKDEKVEGNKTPTYMKEIKQKTKEEYPKANGLFNKEQPGKGELRYKASTLFFYYFFKANNLYDTYVNLVEKLKLIDTNQDGQKKSLRGMRNNGINAHSFKGIKEEDLVQVIGDKMNYFNLLSNKTYSLIGKERQPNTFRKLNELIEREIDNYIKKEYKMNNFC